VTFAALWTNYKKHPMAMIIIPRHSLIGLAVPLPGGETIEINGILFSLLEVSAEEQIPPGKISPYSMSCLRKGNYKYQIIH